MTILNDQPSKNLILFQDPKDLVILDETNSALECVVDDIGWRQWLTHILDIKYIQGIFKFHVQKPFRSQHQQQQQQHDMLGHPVINSYNPFESTENLQETISNPFGSSIIGAILQALPQTILMNHLSMLFGNNKVSANIGFNSRTSLFSSKFMYRHKFFLTPIAERPVYLTTSVINLHTSNPIAGISAAIKTLSLQYRRYNGRNAISLSNRSYWTPFSMSTRKRYLENWKKHYEKEEIVKLPPPPIFHAALPPEMRWTFFRPNDSEVLKTSDLSGFSYYNIMRLVIYYFDTFRNIMHQVSKALRYFVDIQIATAESSLKNYWPIRLSKYRSLFLSRFYEQLYLFSMGPRSRASIEYSWKKGEGYTFSNVYRLPIEMNWGCDIFRIWLFLDLYAESYDKKWKQEHSTTIAITLFDIYTLYTYTLSLNPYFRQLFKFFKFLKAFLMGYIN
jgi:hypothetical protein